MPDMTVHDLSELCRDRGLWPKEVKVLLLTSDGLHKAIPAHRDEPSMDSLILTTGEKVPT